MRVFLLSIVAIFLFSCSTQLKRWTLPGSEVAKIQVGYVQKNNIFDLEWIKPAISSQKLVFKDGQAQFRFNGKLMSVVKTGTQFRMMSNGEVLAPFRVVRTEAFQYPSMDHLSTIIDTKSWTKTIDVSETYRVITGTRTTTTTDSLGRKITFSEPIIETKTRNKQMEKRIYEHRIGFRFKPVITHHFRLSEEQELVLYKTKDLTVDAYYIQNPSYLEAEAFGEKILFLDRNCNGEYDDMQDSMIIDPRRPKNVYAKYADALAAIPRWFRIVPFFRKRGMELKTDKNSKQLLFNNINRQMLSSGSGKLEISGLFNESKILIFVNGKHVFNSIATNGVFRSSIQVGSHDLSVKAPKQLYLEKRIVIKKGKVTSVSMPRGPECGGVHIFSPFELYRVLVKKDGEKDWRIYHDISQFNLFPGQYTIKLDANGRIEEQKIRVFSRGNFRLLFFGITPLVSTEESDPVFHRRAWYNIVEM